MCEPGNVRLVGGVANSTGRLEFCAHGVWGRVCNALGYWGPNNSRVVCHQLGFSEEGKVICSEPTHNLCHYWLCLGAYTIDYEPRFGTSKGDAVIGEVRCIGTEPELLECFHASIGYHRCGSVRANSAASNIIISCYGMNVYTFKL